MPRTSNVTSEASELARTLLHSHLLLIEPQKALEETKSGILIAEDVTQYSKLHLGTVIRAAHDVDQNLKPGTQVYYNRFAPNDVRLDGKEYLVINEEDIALIIQTDVKEPTEASQ